jgi:hypothetical protein
MNKVFPLCPGGSHAREVSAAQHAKHARGHVLISRGCPELCPQGSRSVRILVFLLDLIAVDVVIPCVARV